MSKSQEIRLDMLGLPVLKNLEDLSRLRHISENTIYQLSKHSDKFYKTYTIPKKSGGTRQISHPSKKLKGLQAWILRDILCRLKVSRSCKGFEPHTSTVDNVMPHLGANIVLTLDLKDFFPSVKREYVYNIFHSIGYNTLVSTILTNLCTYNGILPQGSPWREGI